MNRNPKADKAGPKIPIASFAVPGSKSAREMLRNDSEMEFVCRMRFVVVAASSMWLNVAETMGRDVDRLRKFGEDRRDFF